MTAKGGSKQDVMDKRVKTLLLGDSILQGIKGWASTSVSCNLGVNIEELTKKVTRDQLETKFKIKTYGIIVLHVGTNDIPSRRTIPTLLAQYRKLIIAVQSKNDTAQYVISGVLPCLQDSDEQREKTILFNKKLRYLCKQLGMKYVDAFSTFVLKRGKPSKKFFQEDGIHLNSRGALRLKKYFKTHLPIYKTSKKEQDTV